jgi:RNA polymerase sigma factor (sigma-70 family)
MPWTDTDNGPRTIDYPQEPNSRGNHPLVMTPHTTAQAASKPLAVDWQVALAQHDRWLRTVVLARTGEAQAVDEVMQEVALAAVEQRAALADPTKVAPWLYQIAVRQSLLYRRKAGRSRKLTDQYAQRVRPSGADTSTDPLQWLLADERRQHVRAALERLPEEDAEILLLKYTEDWNYHQIAAHLDMSHSAVEAKLHRARKKLRAILNEQ